MRQRIFTTVLFISLMGTLLACSAILGDGEADRWSEGVEKVYVVTDPPGASLVITNVEPGRSASISSNISPNNVYFTRRAAFGTFITISKEGYERKTIKLDETKKKIYVVLQKKDADDQDSNQHIQEGPSIPGNPTGPDHFLLPGFPKKTGAKPDISVSSSPQNKYRP